MDRIQGMEDGADQYLVKPVDMDELAAAIKTVARRIETLEVTISRLRHKLGDDPPIKSVRARGYVFAASLILIANGCVAVAIQG